MRSGRFRELRAIICYPGDIEVDFQRVGTEDGGAGQRLLPDPFVDLPAGVGCARRAREARPARPRQGTALSQDPQGSLLDAVLELSLLLAQTAPLQTSQYWRHDQSQFPAYRKQGLSHRQRHSSGPAPDQQGIVRPYDRISNPFPTKVIEERLDKFIGHILQVLSNCNRDMVVNLLKNSKEKILGLGKYIGVSYLGLGEKLYDAMNELAKSMKNWIEREWW